MLRTILTLSLALSALSGCVGTTVLKPSTDRAFNFKQDTFSYANELAWEYQTDPATGQLATKQNVPKPEFVQRCFAVSRMARQFFQYARFDPISPNVDDASYRRLIATVVSRSPGDTQHNDKVIIPGYANLRSFSQAKESLLKDASGSSLSSYFHFSNWRMIFPFSRTHQEVTVKHLLDEVQVNRLPIVHMIQFSPFPVTTIDHVIVIVSGTETNQEIRFKVYDPNNIEQPGLLTFDRASRTFIFPSTNYFAKGPLDVYEIYGDELN
jgi:hypothetical protein